MDKKSVQFFIGTSGWSYDGWRGDFYPGGLPKARWFDFYAQHFNAVEVNATFYRTFKDETYRKWRDQALAGFRYALKAPRLITHRKMLMDVSDEIRIFAESAHILGETLGMILMQLAPGMPLDLPRLRAALSAFLDTSEVAVEFRHERWDSAETINLLREMRATWVCADSPKNPLRERLTGKNAYVRLHGRRQ